MQTKSFSIRKFRMADVDCIVELLKNVFGDEFSRELWLWKYAFNPAGFYGEKGDIWLAEAGGKIVGYWAVIPERMKVGCETVTVAQAVDAATHPDYRGQGIFKTLVKQVCMDARNRYPFIFGFPNELYRGYEKLGWRSFRLTEFLYPLNTDLLLESQLGKNAKFYLAKAVLKTFKIKNFFSFNFHLKKTKNDNIEIKEIRKFPVIINEFWKLVRSRYKIVIERDSSFLNWRFSRYFGDYQKFILKSVNDGEIKGYVILKRTSLRGIPNILEIVDLQTSTDDDGTLEEVIKFVIEIAKREEVTVIYCRVSTWHRQAKVLRDMGFISVGRLLDYAIYQPRLIIYPLSSRLSFEVNEWFFTLADTDYA